MKKPLLSLGILALATMASQASLTSVHWTGGAANHDWETTGNWDSNAVPIINGVDRVFINDADVTYDSGHLIFEGGSDLTLTGNSTLTVTHGDFKIHKSGASIIVIEAGSTIKITDDDSHFRTYESGIYDLKGTVIAAGASSNPLLAPNGIEDGGFDFTAVGAKMQFDNYTGSNNLLTYLNMKADIGSNHLSFFRIEGTKVNGFGISNAVNGKYIEFDGTNTDGTLTLVAVPVPEPSSVALLGLGGLAFILRRRK